MRVSIVALRTPMIRFLGKRANIQVPPETPVNSPKQHSQAAGSLPVSFVEYRKNAQTHGPLAGKGHAPQTVGSGAAAAVSVGEYSSREELPSRFRYSSLSEEEMANINAGGAEVVF